MFWSCGGWNLLWWALGVVAGNFGVFVVVEFGVGLDVGCVLWVLLDWGGLVVGLGSWVFWVCLIWV